MLWDTLLSMTPIGCRARMSQHAETDYRNLLVEGHTPYMMVMLGTLGRLGAVGQQCLRKGRIAAYTCKTAMITARVRQAHLDVDIGNAVADSGCGGRVALAHLLGQLHVALLGRVRRVRSAQRLHEFLFIIMYSEIMLSESANLEPEGHRAYTQLVCSYTVGHEANVNCYLSLNPWTCHVRRVCSAKCIHASTVSWFPSL